MRTFDDQEYFHYPVDEEAYPDYRAVIPEPMDLLTLEENLDKGVYATLQPFLVDVDLIALNCLHFNQAESEIGETAKVFAIYSHT